MIQAVGFDFGNTLAYHEGIPLNWESNYTKAIRYSLQKVGVDYSDQLCSAAIDILRKYNTQINPRTNEVQSKDIFAEIGNAISLPSEITYIFETEFFSFFSQKMILFADTIPLLRHLHSQNIRSAILTDAPYGMRKELILKEMNEIIPYIDLVLSSTEIGYRKPHTEGYIQLSKKLNVEPINMIYIGDEQEDIQGANKANIYSILINRTKIKVSYGERMQIAKLTDLMNRLL